MRMLLLVTVLGCGSRGQATIDAKTEPEVCKAERDADLDRTCSVPADCVLVESEDCCGPVMIAVKAGTESGFPTVESAFDACLACPPLGCAHQPLAEDGTAPLSGQTIVATCAANRCTSIVQ